MTADVAILHDRMPQYGGGERFAVDAARVLDAPLYTMYVRDGVDVPADVDLRELRPRKYTAGLSQYALRWAAGGMNPLETLSVQLDWSDADVGAYDTVLSSGPLSKAYVPAPDQRVLHYPHSPSRWLYDLYRDRTGAFDYPLVGAAVRAYAEAHRALDRSRNAHVDRFIANSETVARRVERYYDRGATVVYPPVTGDWRCDGDEGYFVTWSRLTADKRVGLICEAFAGLDAQLVIAGDGPERDTVERYAREHANIEYRGYVDDIESLVARATAVVYAPTQEDFGLVGAEALAAGKPLLGVDEGFTREQVTPGVTGERFSPDVARLRDTVRAFDPGEYDTWAIQREGDQYSRERFAARLREVVAE